MHRVPSMRTLSFYQRVGKITEADGKKPDQPVRIFAMSGFSQSATLVVIVVADHNVFMVSTLQTGDNRLPR